MIQQKCARGQDGVILATVKVETTCNMCPGKVSGHHVNHVNEGVMLTMLIVKIRSTLGEKHYQTLDFTSIGGNSAWRRTGAEFKVEIVCNGNLVW